MSSTEAQEDRSLCAVAAPTSVNIQRAPADAVLIYAVGLVTIQSGASVCVAIVGREARPDQDAAMATACLFFSNLSARW